jgi:hypothetical protein
MSALRLRAHDCLSRFQLERLGLRAHDCFSRFELERLGLRAHDCFRRLDFERRDRGEYEFLEATRSQLSKQISA